MRFALAQRSARFHFGRLLPWLYLAILAAINVYICREAFVTEATGHWHSIHGQWISLARIAGLDWIRPTWWPYWGGGAPLEYTYAPLIPMAMAAISRLFHCSPELALSLLTGLVYCLGPIAFYVVSWNLTRRPGYSFAAALAWSLTSPVALLIPDHGLQLSSIWTARRLYIAFDWDELPHLTSLTLLPISVWALARALKSSRLLDYGIAASVMVVMMLANMFGMVLAGLAVITVPLALEPRFRPTLLLRAILCAAAAYLVVSPWIPPSLLFTIRDNAARNGEGGWSLPAAIALGIVAISLWTVWKVSASYALEWSTRWMLLFGWAVISIAALGQFGNLHFLPQPVRYKVEAEPAMLWIAVFALRPAMERAPKALRISLVSLLVILAGQQIFAFRRIAKGIIHTADTRQSVEYRSAKWVEQNLPGQRVLMAGSLGNFLNTFTRVQQLSAQPYTTAPNWEEQIAIYTIYSGQNAGDRDAEYSLLWLRAFGVQAVAVSGPRSTEYWHPFARPRKFEGLLPVLWREDDTAIYAVPQRSGSLAHVLKPEQLVRRPPVHGLDTNEVLAFVTAMESSRSPAALEWRDSNRARIRALLASGDIVSTRINYRPGWHAFVNGRSRAVRPDGIGLMVVEAECAGDCEIALQYDGGTEARLCRAASVAVLLLFAAASYRQSSRRRRQSPAAIAASADRARLV